MLGGSVSCGEGPPRHLLIDRRKVVVGALGARQPFLVNQKAAAKHLKKGERIRIAGLGILQVRKRAARMGRTATGEAIKIKVRKSRSVRPRN